MSDEKDDDLCPTCKGKGEVLYMYSRPGGPPGNQMILCPECSNGESSDRPHDDRHAD